LKEAGPVKYRRFEELPVGQAAVEFALLVFKFTSIADLHGLGDTKGQLERSALSSSNNIAIGFERGTNVERINLLYIARGSVGECRSILCLCEKVPRFSNFKSEISNLKLKAENISKQLYGWIESLKNSDINGDRFSTPKLRDRIAHERRFEEFDHEMDELRRLHLERLNRREEEAEMRQMDIS